MLSSANRLVFAKANFILLLLPAAPFETATKGPLRTLQWEGGISGPPHEPLSSEQMMLIIWAVSKVLSPLKGVLKTEVCNSEMLQRRRKTDFAKERG